MSEEARAQWLKDAIYTLSDECDSRALRSPQQISSFVNHALSIKYGKNGKIPVSEIVAEVFKNVNGGVKDLPELPEEFAPPNLETQEINNKVKETAKALGKQYRSDNKRPRLDQIHKDVQKELGLIDDTGDILKLISEEDSHIIAMATSLIGQVMSDSTPNYTDEGLKSTYEEVNKDVFPE